jgi:glycosyltransferase involved in cell wall biosynthesis
MSEVVPGSNTEIALASRLRTVARVLLEDDLPAEPDPWRQAARLLDALTRSVQRDLAPDRMWLLYTAVSTVFPEADELTAALRTFDLSTPEEAMLWLLERCFLVGRHGGWPELEIELLTDSVVVEVDFSARHEIHTGIQRVVRSTLPRWHRDQQITPVAWTPERGAFRTLLDDEADRVLRWRGAHAATGDGSSVGDLADGDDRPRWRLIVPWHCTVVLPEVPARDTCDRLATMAQFSGNRVVAIGYDCIPVVSADMVPLVEPNRFVRYLSVVKHVRRLAGISVSATAEFRGFAQMLATQGVTGPRVVECALPVDAAADVVLEPSSAAEPLVLCVGSFEPRKNQLAVLFAAEVLWREGLRFRLQFVGGGGWGREFPTSVRRLARRGRPVSVSTAISEEALKAAYRGAHFTVFASTHEGYGLPVAESLSLGTPVITSNYGSTREIGLAGGTVLIDPRDDSALVDAMRELLTDPAQVQKLRDEIPTRPTRTWDDYSRELWTCLVAPEQAVS